jgi:predicted Fe-Mo cluster-binding NifX family protein
MRIGVTSQNFRTITGHAGKTRRFLIFEQDATGTLGEAERLDLPLEMSLHEFRGDNHPLFALDAIITESCGGGFVQRLARHGVRVIATSATDPLSAATALASGLGLPEPLPHDHGHNHGQDDGPGTAIPVDALTRGH